MGVAAHDQRFHDLVDAIAEVKEMGREGMAHPSTKPVLVAAGAGAVAAALLPELGNEKRGCAVTFTVG